MRKNLVTLAVLLYLPFIAFADNLAKRTYDRNMVDPVNDNSVYIVRNDGTVITVDQSQIGGWTLADGSVATTENNKTSTGGQSIGTVVDRQAAGSESGGKCRFDSKGNVIVSEKVCPPGTEVGRNGDGKKKSKEFCYEPEAEKRTHYKSFVAAVESIKGENPMCDNKEYSLYVLYDRTKDDYFLAHKAWFADEKSAKSTSPGSNLPNGKSVDTKKYVIMAHIHNHPYKPPEGDKVYVNDAWFSHMDAASAKRSKVDEIVYNCWDGRILWLHAREKGKVTEIKDGYAKDEMLEVPEAVRKATYDGVEPGHEYYDPEKWSELDISTSDVSSCNGYIGIKAQDDVKSRPPNCCWCESPRLDFMIGSNSTGAVSCKNCRHLIGVICRGGTIGSPNPRYNGKSVSEFVPGYKVGMRVSGMQIW